MTTPAHLTCDFCVASTPSRAYLVSGFHIETPLEWFFNADGAWAACEFCASLIDGSRVDELVQRVVRLFALRGTQHPQLAAHCRVLFSAVDRYRTDSMSLADPRIARLAHVEGEPIGVGFYPNGDGTGQFVPIQPAPRHPFQPC
jgi:hypothetical protein